MDIMTQILVQKLFKIFYLKLVSGLEMSHINSFTVADIASQNNNKNNSELAIHRYGFPKCFN